MKLFDFLIVPVRRSGGTAIQTFISLHPGIVAIPKGNLDRCLKDHREEELLESFQDLMLSNPDARVGLVQHRYIGEHEDLDSIAERLSRIVRKDGLVMVVRNHFDALLSEMNHGGIAEYCNYSFAKAGLFWPDRVELRRGVRPFLGEVKSPSCEPYSPDACIDVEKALFSDKALNKVRYAAIQETYERYFSSATVFDYDDLLSPNNRNAMRTLFETLKADKDFHLPFFAIRQAGTHHRFLSHNRMNIFSEHVTERPVALTPANSHELVGMPIGSVYDGYIRDLFAEELIFLTSPFEASEMEKRQFDAFPRGFFYPLWRNNYEIVSQVINGFRAKNLSKEQRSLVKERLAPDTARFFEMNPDLANRWGPSWESA